MEVVLNFRCIILSLFFDFQKHESHIPPAVKLVASQNCTMREEINMHRKVIFFIINVDLINYFNK